MYTERVFKKINDDVMNYLEDVGKSTIDDLTKVEEKEFLENMARDLGEVRGLKVGDELLVGP